jgi:hypothetical protein
LPKADKVKALTGGINGSPFPVGLFAMIREL